MTVWEIKDTPARLGSHRGAARPQEWGETLYKNDLCSMHSHIESEIRL